MANAPIEHSGDRIVSARYVILGCWAVFVVVWVITAGTAKPTAQRQSLSGRAAYLGLLAVAVALFAGLWRPYPLDVTVVPRGIAIDISSAFVCALGLACAIWARHTLAGNWSSSVNLKQGHELIQDGPYRYVRHPIYSGILLMFVGTAMAIGRLDAWLGLLAAFASFWIKLRQEDALMAQHFPDSYPAYRRRVRALVPNLF
jgi:protein-S-isoprenylcysteine O-methyltransferase Ste14